MILTHKICIKPNNFTKKLFEKYFGYSRFCYNRGLETWNNEYNNGNKPNFRSVRNLNKQSRYEWESEYTPVILESALEDLDRGFKMYFNKINKHPKFKSKRLANNSFRINRKNETTIRIKEYKLFLPKFPYGIKLTELPRYNGIIKSCTISKKADKYFASLSIELSNNITIDNPNTNSVGIDLGIKTFATYAYDEPNDDTLYYNMEQGIYKKLLPLYSKISFYQRLLSKKNKLSSRYQVMKTKLQRLYLRIFNIQKDFLNKFTTKLCKEFKIITIEDLSVSNMIKNRKLSKVISRSLFYTFRCMLEYKSKLYGNILVIANKWFPSTQTCYSCNHVRTKSDKLKLSDRTYKCPICGNEIDRDINASINLKLYGTSMVKL